MSKKKRMRSQNGASGLLKQGDMAYSMYLNYKFGSYVPEEHLSKGCPPDTLLAIAKNVKEKMQGIPEEGEEFLIWIRKKKRV